LIATTYSIISHSKQAAITATNPKDNLISTSVSFSSNQGGESVVYLYSN